MFPTSVAPAAASRNVPSWEYGKPVKQPLLPAYLCRLLTHEDSAQLTKLRYRHHSGLCPSENGDGSLCQRPVLCSHRVPEASAVPGWNGSLLNRERGIKALFG